MEQPSKEQLQKEAAEHREAQRKKDKERLEESEKETAKHAWMADGGTAEEFERSWPEMKRQSHMERAREADNAARADHFRQTRSAF